MTGLASPGVLHPGWYDEIKMAGVKSELPGLYEWRIEGVGCSIGQYTHARRPRREYGLNVGRILAARPYRKSNPEGSRQIHRKLANAVNAGCRIENEVDKVKRNHCERELIADRRAKALSGGLPVLNSG